METVKLTPIKVSEEYRKEWNISPRQDDFFHLYLNNQKVSDVLYRIGGIYEETETYIKLLQQVESFYPDDITKVEKDKKHLSNRDCIINKYTGEVKVVANKFAYLTLHGGCIYSVHGMAGKSIYKNIEAEQTYGSASSVVQSTEYIFLEKRYEKNKEENGVYQIKKSDGSVTFYPGN